MIKKNIHPFNNKRQKHGLWIHYENDGSLWSKCYWINDIKHGYWIENWHNNPNITLYLK